MIKRIFSISLISAFILSITCYADEEKITKSLSQKKWPEISLTPVVSGLKKPTHITHAGDKSGRLFLTEQKGRVLIVKNNKILKTPFL